MTRNDEFQDKRGRHAAVDDDRPRLDGIDRRTVLCIGSTVAVTGVAGCGYIGQTGGSDSADCPSPPADLSGPVPGEYEGSISQGETERDAEKLVDRSEANYQTEPNGDQRCERCSYYVEDSNGDCLGACVRVKGYIDPQGWCEYYRTQVGGGW